MKISDNIIEITLETNVTRNVGSVVKENTNNNESMVINNDIEVVTNDDMNRRSSTTDKKYTKTNILNRY